MATLEASTPPPLSMSFNSTNIGEIFICLLNSTDGSPLPENVIDSNPYKFDPKHLPRDVWYLISSKEEINTAGGLWRTKEEACEVFANSDIIGWKTALEFYSGKVSDDQYVMEEFNITMKRLDDKNEKKETSSLCRLYLVALTPEISGNATRNPLSPPIDLDANSSSSRIGSSRNPEVNKHDEVESLAVADRIPSPERRGEDRFEMDLFAGGDFLELKDLDNAAQSSSSSDNSSVAMSISSDECFDALAFLQELDDPVLEQRDSTEKLDVFTANKPDECVLVPAALESIVSVEGSDESLKSTARSTHTSPPRSRDGDNDVAKHARRDEGPSSSHKPSESRTATAGGRKRRWDERFEKVLLLYGILGSCFSQDGL